MSFYDINIESLAGRNEMALILREKGYSLCNKLSKIESIEARDHNKAIILNYNDNEYRLNSVYRPIEEAKRWADQFDFNNINVVFNLFGLGNGFFAEALLNNMNEEDSLVIYEPCTEIFLHVLEHYDISKLLSDERVYLYIEGMNEDKMYRELSSLISIANLGLQTQCVHPNYNLIFEHSHLNFYKILKDAFSSVRININTEVILSKEILKNITNNIQYLQDSSSISDLKKVIDTEKVPAIMVAAGPSVEENIEELKKAKNKAVIFAVDRILDYLLDHDVIPDFVLTIDPRKKIEHFSRRSNISIPLITYLDANHLIYKNHSGKKIICTYENFVKEMYEELGKEPPIVSATGSVAVTAFNACVCLGFKQIILVGQDLAYGTDKTHAGNLSDAPMEIKDEYVMGVKGEMVRSRYDWKEFILIFNHLIAENKDVEVIDAKSNGAKLEGTILMPLSEAVNNYSHGRFDINDVCNKLDKTFNQEDYMKLKEFFEDNLLVLEKIKKKAKEASIACSQLIRHVNESIGSKKNKLNLNKLEKANKYIYKQTIYSILDHAVLARTTTQMQDMNKFSKDVENDSIKTYENAKDIYNAIINVIDDFYPEFKKAVEAL